MKHIRIGNDIVVRWTIKRNGSNDKIQADSCKIVLSCRDVNKVIDDYVVDGNTIIFTFYGKEQQVIGVYKLMYVENYGIEGMHTLDHCDAFALTDTCQTDNGDCPCDNIYIDTIELSSELSAPGNGLSAYELALKHGFVGTVDDWLKSLKGAKGDKGDSGNINYPTFVVNDAMELVMDTQAASDNDRFDIVDGNLILDLY